MQFKNPEIFYFLAILIIPIIVHLFQLQKFVKVPFSNVAFLQKIVQQTRKSSRLKKWLILLNRILLFTAILFAFSQPFLGTKNSNTKQHTFIYLDNSLSTDTAGEKGNLLKITAQEIIEYAAEQDVYSLQTNDANYNNITKLELKNTLLNLKNTTKKVDFKTILLHIDDKRKNETNTLYKNILISDFQGTYENEFTNVTPAFSAIQLQPVNKNNISIDSIFIDNTNANNFTLNVRIKNQGKAQNNIPISVFNDARLVSKQSFSIEKDTFKTVPFTIQNQSEFNGKISITFSDTFSFDNQFFFTFTNEKKLDILSIGNNQNYLSKIYTNKEFNYQNFPSQNVNYNTILKQDFILLSGLKEVPETLSNTLLEFCNNGGNLAIIPDEEIELNSYNQFFKKLSLGKLETKIKDTLKITSINYNHPLFKNVFSKQVSNFQYPTVYSYYPIIANKATSKIVSFENNANFINQINRKKSKVYWISASLDKSNSNFINSPLIVPVFYNFAKLSFQYSQLFYRLATENQIDIEATLKKDEILKISNATDTFIPLQQTYQQKVTVTTEELPIETGFYSIVNKTDTIQKLAFNYPKQESILQFMDVQELKKKHKNVTVFSTIKDVFTDIHKKNEVHWLWKWFLALAIVSLFLEILILKFYKL